MKLPKIIGKIIYITNYHMIYRHIRGSLRAYVIIKSGNQVLLTKNWLGLHRDWRLPGGGVKAGESAIAAVIRETQEEIGVCLKPSQLKLLAKKTLSKQGFYYQIYTANLADEPNVTISAEIVAAQFFDKSQVKKLHLSEVSRRAIEELGWS